MKENVMPVAVNTGDETGDKKLCGIFNKLSFR